MYSSTSCSVRSTFDGSADALLSTFVLSLGGFLSSSPGSERLLEDFAAATAESILLNCDDRHVSTCTLMESSLEHVSAE